jgi:hypothetical protein
MKFTWVIWRNKKDINPQGPKLLLMVGIKNKKILCRPKINECGETNYVITTLFPL